ncbi:MAG TPA: right-handed parallel beta-helix repeat-containing protein [Pyrinomonadaceae bacterium]|jgi:hypothetical protein
MKATAKFFANKFSRVYCLTLIAVVMVGAVALSGLNASANHPVYVEGNCNPFQPFVAPNTCGDFDGDGRVGTAEDADSATDRIFGTINGALGSTALGNAADGSGPIAPSTAGMNGRVIIVTSGRFAETITIAPLPSGFGNVEIEAARGVEANIDAVVQGDAANTNRQNSIGVSINSPSTGIVTLRNLTIRNFLEGIRLSGTSRVNIDNCNIDNNRNIGVRAIQNSRLTMNHGRIVGTGFRSNPAVDNTPNNGSAIRLEDSAIAWIANTTIFHNFGPAISQEAAGMTLTLFEVVCGDNNTGSGTDAACVSISATPTAAPAIVTGANDEDAP